MSTTLMERIVLTRMKQIVRTESTIGVVTLTTIWGEAATPAAVYTSRSFRTTQCRSPASNPVVPTYPITAFLRNREESIDPECAHVKTKSTQRPALGCMPLHVLMDGGPIVDNRQGPADAVGARIMERRLLQVGASRCRT